MKTTNKHIIKKTIHKFPACKDWKGNEYPERWGVTLTDNLGLRWDGGEYATREEAVRS